MILEVAMLNIKPNLTPEFETAFRQASKIISSMNGFINLELQKCLEQPDKYLLLVKWETLEDHTVGFRGSSEYQDQPNTRNGGRCCITFTIRSRLWNILKKLYCS
jgi:heme-degrading monooxygenase HmoA